MPTTNECLSKLTKLGGVAVIALALLLPAVTVQAGEMTLKGKSILSKANSTWIQIGEDEGHGIGTYENYGVQLLDDGQVATATNKGFYDWNKGQERHEGYFIATFPDGSTITDHYQGTARKEGDLTHWEGTDKIIAGTGKFEGAKGEGSYKGTRYSNGMGVTDFKVNLILPD